ncbi:MAG TPA: protein kinase [Gemmatimonadaceae bacterium]
MTDLRAQLQATLGAAYTIDRELGGGGMSRVFVGTEAALGRQIVIKVLPADTMNAVSIERFKREINVVARLQHPHIVPILTAGESEGVPFYTMPFVKGDSLRERLASKGPLTVRETVHVLRDVASALGYAHAEGVVHRDIKPENVILSGGVAVVTDFGVAKALDVATHDGSVAAAGLTSLGMSVGTPAYMSPEQATAEPDVDQRADVYSFGCIAYEMLTGSSPFAGRSSQQMIAAHVTATPEPIPARRADVPPALAELVLRCLEKDRNARPGSAEQLLAALDALATPSGETPAGSRAAARSTRRVMIGIGATAVLVGATAVVLMRREPAAPVLGSVMQVTRSTDALNFDASISPDGQFVAYAVGPAGHMKIVVRQVTGSSAVTLAPSLAGDQRWPRWSPDGSKIAFTSDRSVYVIPVLGGVPRLVADSALQPSWSPDGQQLTYVMGSNLMTVAAGGGAPRRIATNADLSTPVWSPDGERIAYVSENGTFTNAGNGSYGNASPSSIWIVGKNGGDSIRVSDSSNLNASPAWSSDGRSIFFVSDRDGTRDIYRQRLNSSGLPQGAPDRITSGLEVYTFTLSRDGTRMAYGTLHLRSNIWMVPIPTIGSTTVTAAHAVTNEKQAIEGMAISHDGKWLAFDSNRNGNEDVFKVAFNGSIAVGDPIALTTNPSADYEPRWSADDQEIVFYSRRFGTRDVFTVKADGRDERRVTDLPSQEFYPDWSPNGKAVVFTTSMVGGTGRDAVFVARRNDAGQWSPATRITDTTARPVGQDARFLSDSSVLILSRRELRVVPLTGGPMRVVADLEPLGEAPIFVTTSPDRATVYVATTDSSRVVSYWSVAASGGPLRRILRLDDPARRTRRIEFDTDGKNLFFTLAADEADVAVATLKRP